MKTNRHLVFGGASRSGPGCGCSPGSRHRATSSPCTGAHALHPPTPSAPLLIQALPRDWHTGEGVPSGPSHLSPSAPKTWPLPRLGDRACGCCPGGSMQHSLPTCRENPRISHHHRPAHFGVTFGELLSGGKLKDRPRDALWRTASWRPSRPPGELVLGPTRFPD